MRTSLLTVTCLLLLSSCFIFQRKEKYGCPANGRNVGAEKLASEDPDALKASQKAKYKGGRKSY